MLSLLFRLLGGDRVLVGINTIALPYHEKDGKFKIHKFSSTFILVESIDGFQLLWDQDHRIYLKVDPAYKSKVRKCSPGGKVCIKMLRSLLQ